MCGEWIECVSVDYVSVECGVWSVECVVSGVLGVECTGCGGCEWGVHGCVSVECVSVEGAVDIRW